MEIPTERIPQESEDDRDSDDTTSSVEDPGESSHRSLSDMLSSAYTRSRLLSLSPPPSPARTRSHGKARKTKDREPFYKGFGVVYIPGDINSHLLAAEFFADNITVRNELVHVLDALLRLKQLTRKEYTDIIARLAVSL